MTQSTPAESPFVGGVEREPREPGASFGLQILTVVVAAGACLTLWAVSVPGTYLLLLMALPFAWFMLGLIWVILGLLLVQDAGIRAALRNGWLVGIAVLVLATAAAVRTDLPLRARFELSRGSLEAVAAKSIEPVASSAPAGQPDRWIGLFDAERIERFDGGFRFLVKGTGFLDPVGLAYSPFAPPPNLGGEDFYEPFSGPWWIWVESW
jgi:hypothetical protein